MAGNFPFFATFRVTTQDAEALGAFSLVPTIEHGPDSLQVFFPVDNDETSHVSGVVELFLTIDFLTVKPGRASSRSVAAATCPVAVFVVMAKL